MEVIQVYMYNNITHDFDDTCIDELLQLKNVSVDVPCATLMIATYAIDIQIFLLLQLV